MFLLHNSKRQRPIGQLLARCGTPVRGRAALPPADLAGVATEEPVVVEHGPGGVRAARRLRERIGVVHAPGRIAGHVVLRRAHRARRAAGVEGGHSGAAVDLYDPPTRVGAADGPAGIGEINVGHGQVQALLFSS